MLVSSGLFCSSSWKFNFKNNSSASLEGALTCSSASLGLEGGEGEEEEGKEEGGEGRRGKGRGEERGEGKSSRQTQWRGSFSTGEFQPHSFRLTTHGRQL